MSKMRIVPFNDATEAQLREYARDALQISIHHKAGMDTIRQQILAVHQGDIMVADEIEEAADHDPVTVLLKPDGTPVTMKDIEQTSAYDPVVNITISPHDGEGGMRPIGVGCGERHILFEVNKPIDVKYRHYEILKNAVRQNISQSAPGSDVDLIVSPMQTHAFTVNRHPPKDQVDAWHRAQRA